MPRCSIGVLLADATGSQFYSTLEPLSKEQLQRIKAGPGKKPRLAAGAVSAPAAAVSASAAAQGDAAVALCLLPIHLGEGAAAAEDEAVFFFPLAPRAPGRGGTGGGGAGGVSEEDAAKGRDVAGQLLHSPHAVVCFNMQGG